MSADEKTSLLSGEEDAKNSRRTKRRCGVILREEFRCKNFTFQFHDEGVFYKSQWRWPRVVFVVFRLAVAIYIVTMCILTIVYFPHKNPHRPWPVWLTNWSYLLLTIHELVAATIAVLHRGDRDDDVKRNLRGTEKKRVPIPCYIRFDWFLFSIAAPVAALVSLGNVFGLMADPSLASTITTKDINNHMINGLVVLLEFCIAALPVRLLHVVYVIAYFLLYCLFSVVFWSADHTGNVVYPGFIDWNSSADTVLGVIVMMVGLCCVTVLLFAVYRLRLFIYEKIYGDKPEAEFEPVQGLL